MLRPSSGRAAAVVQEGVLPQFGLAEALIDEHLIGVAVGMVAVQRQQSPQAALGSLVGIAHRTDRSIVEVARHLVERHRHTGHLARAADHLPGWDTDPAV